MMFNKTKIVLVLELVAAVVLSTGCGSYKDDLEKMCNVEALSAVPIGEPDVMQAARREWLDGELSSSKGKELFEALGMASPEGRASILKEQASSEGIAQCPHAEMMSYSIFESSQMQLPVSAAPVPLEKGTAVMVGGSTIYVDGMSVVQLENGFIPAGQLQAGGDGAFIKPLLDYLSERVQREQALAKRLGAQGSAANAVVAADYRLSSRLIFIITNTLKQAGIISVQLAVSIKDKPWHYAAIPTRLTAQTAGPALTITPSGFVLTPHGGSPVQIPKANNTFNWGMLAAALRQSWMGAQNQLQVRVNGDLSYGELISTINAARFDGSGWLYPNVVLNP